MSGKQQFDDGGAINSAMTVFWRRGYSATSIDELTAEMGLSRSSLYRRFRDKEGLFQEVLATYNSRVTHRMGLVEAETGRARIEALLLHFVTGDQGRSKPSGCMLVKACSEIAELPPGGRAAALAGIEAQRAILREILTTAVSDGELSASTEVEALVWHFLGVLQAIMNMPQIGATSNDLRRMVASAMCAWPQNL